MRKAMRGASEKTEKKQISRAKPALGMTALRAVAIAAVVTAVVVGLGARAQSAKGEVTVIAPGGIRAAMEQLIPGFEIKTGYEVKATFGSGGATHQQVLRGDACDVAVVQPPYHDVIDSGNVAAASEKRLASIALGVAVRQGAAKPDISTPEAVKKTFLAAKAISYPDAARGAAAGVIVDEMFKKLGVADQLQSKVKPALGAAGAMQMVAKGDAEIGITFLSEMQDPGIDVVGPLPRTVVMPTDLVGFVSAHAKDPAAAKALLEYLASPEAALVYKAQRMQPAR